jgi:hypothetical protein
MSRHKQRTYRVAAQISTIDIGRHGAAKQWYVIGLEKGRQLQHVVDVVACGKNVPSTHVHFLTDQCECTVGNAGRYRQIVYGPPAGIGVAQIERIVLAVGLADATDKTGKED